MSLYRLITLVFIGTLLSSCNATDTSSLARQPLLVDLNAVARALGRDEAINKKLEEARESLNTQLKEIGASLETQLQEKKAELEKAAKDRKKSEREESEQALQQLTLQAQLQLKQTQQLAEQKAAQYRAQLLAEFRAEVMDSAKVVAGKRGALTVLAVGPEYLWYASEIDITDEVIGLMRSQPAQPAKVTPQADANDGSAEDKPAK